MINNKENKKRRQNQDKIKLTFKKKEIKPDLHIEWQAKSKKDIKNPFHSQQEKKDFSQNIQPK